LSALCASLLETDQTAIIMIMRQQLYLSCLAMLPLVSFSFSVVSIGSSAATTSTAARTTTSSSTTTTALYGLFDGVKDAFSAPTLERSKIDAERETPIDRWMGWSVSSENKKNGQQQAQQLKAIGTFLL
jgi:hypothetical protein